MKTAPTTTTPNTRRTCCLVQGLFPALAAVWFLASCATPPPTPYPGRIVGHRVVSTDEHRAFSVKLSPSPDWRARLKFHDLRLLTIHEVPVHEKMLEYKIDESGDRSGLHHEVVPDEFIEGPEEVRNETKTVGPLTRCALTLDGQAIRTGPDGVYVDDQEYLLSLFDVPFRKEVRLVLHCAGRNDVALRITRQELLASLGVDSSQGRAGPRKKLRFQVEVPSTLRAGETGTVRVKAENHESTPVWGVDVRLFSATPWLGGKSFYFGRIDPGGVRVFERRLRAPGDAQPGIYYALLAFMDWLGPNKDKNVPIALRVLPAAKQSAPAAP